MYNLSWEVDGMPMKAREAIRRLKREGWIEKRQTGSHKQFVKDGVRITVPDHPGDLKPKMEEDIRKKAGWKAPMPKEDAT